MQPKKRPLSTGRLAVFHKRFNEYIGMGWAHYFYNPFPTLQKNAIKIRKELRSRSPDFSKIYSEVESIRRYVTMGKQTQKEWADLLKANKQMAVEIPEYIVNYMELIFPLRMLEMEQLLKNVVARKGRK